jgi:hypothetical protein
MVGRSSGRRSSAPDGVVSWRGGRRRRFAIRPRGGLVSPPEPAGWYLVAWLGGVCGVGALLVGAIWAGRSPSPLTWYIARAAGLTLYLVFWLALMTGFGITLRRPRQPGGRSANHALHRFLVGLGFGLLTLHLMPLLLDSSVPFGPTALLVPFASPAAEPWTGFGVVAFWIAVGVVTTAALWRVVHRRVWRTLHVLAVPAYGLSLLHGVGAGTDSTAVAVQLVYLATAAIAFFATAFRVLTLRSRRRTAKGLPSAPPFDRLAGAGPARRTRAGTIGDRVRWGGAATVSPRRGAR